MSLAQQYQPQSIAVQLPHPGSPVTLEQMEDAEHAVTLSLPLLHDIRAIEEQRDKIAALETYLKGKQAHLPARGAQRRLEARIGQLLGESVRGSNQHSVTTESSNIAKDDRSDFRVLARALNGTIELTKDEWRQSRRALVKLIKDRTPEPENMEVMEGEAKPDTLTGPRISIPDGLSAAEFCRRGIALQEQGMNSHDVARELGVGSGTYRQMADIVLLSERRDLSRRDKKIVAAALENLETTYRVSEAWPMIEQVAARVWGTPNERRAGSRAASETARHEKFEYAFGLVMQSCEDAAEMGVPYLSEDRANAAVKQLSTAIQHLRTLSKRIMEIYS